MIHIKTIPHGDHRYSTLGDYWRDENGAEQFRVSDLGNDDYAFLVILHEFIEWYLTEKRGIKEEDIKVFDEKFDEEKAQGLHAEGEEPGFDPRAPYLREHAFATKIETLIAEELGISWDEYETALKAFLKNVAV